MKTVKIKRADGTVLVATPVGPNKYRLTLNGKPFNIGEAMLEGFKDE
jgi:hypothetical protein